VFHPAVTRSGKTVTLFNLIDYGYKEQYSTVVITGKASKGPSSLYAILSKPKYKKYEIFDITGHHDNKYVYDPFKKYTDIEIIDMIITLGEWTEPHYKELFKRYFSEIIKTLKAIEQPINIETLVKSMRIDELKQKVMDYFKENKIKDKDLLTKIKIDLDKIKIYEEDAIKSLPRFENLINGQARDLFIDETKESFNLLDILNENRKILLVLDGLGLKTFTQTFGNLIIIELLTAIQNTDNHDIKYSVLDEISSYLSENIVDLLNKTLEYNNHTYISTQSPSDVIAFDEALLARIADNCNQFILQRLNSPESVNFVAELIGTQDDLKLTVKYDNETDGSEEGSARRIEEFIVHPNDIKKFKKGTGAFVDKDNDVVRQLVYFKYRGQNEL
jgi:hypothetical protein